ncbi:MAG: hypothetical protein HY852_23810 [Bradyrhizobium sp.]|uniref:hypothetical protein n=1 Tax=Bradyrhizobium sp. TaxID=376 RepID=UPI0025B8A943|nr:hypothetical protein [Bradyrhizobium sp.]MBI5264833.1 hypothetical protein [Bradyrhizobium sp.]
MVPSVSHAHQHDHEHAHGHSHAGQVHGHAHGPASPHPAQVARWSILRMTLAQRLAAAVAASAVLWGIVWLAMR